jgi:protocatechuate 3,4-dioxygenase, alpha subunit
MSQSIVRFRETASQTGGPYVHIGLAPKQAGFEIFDNNFGNHLVTHDTDGERIRIEGRVLDGLGLPMRDVLIEIWHADSHGHYAHPADPQPSRFRGWGRTGADFDTGVYVFDTIKPGAVGTQAPHVAFWIVARGINMGLHTRMYFGDESAANAKDPVLNMIEWEPRRNTLVAKRAQRDGKVVYMFDIRVQGQGPQDAETVFFDI